MPQHPSTTVKLNTGREIPRLALGVFRAPRGEVTRQAVLSAIAAGYRHIDTARIYGNERDVGAAVRDSGLPREELFVTTKLWNEDQGYDAALRACERSLKELGLEYVDLYLVHWPVPGRRLDSWRALEKLFREGKPITLGPDGLDPLGIVDASQDFALLWHSKYAFRIPDFKRIAFTSVNTFNASADKVARARAAATKFYGDE